SGAQRPCALAHAVTDAGRVVVRVNARYPAAAARALRAHRDGRWWHQCLADVPRTSEYRLVIGVNCNFLDSLVLAGTDCFAGGRCRRALVVCRARQSAMIVSDQVRTLRLVRMWVKSSSRDLSQTPLRLELLRE